MARLARGCPTERLKDGGRGESANRARVLPAEEENELKDIKYIGDIVVVDYSHQRHQILAVVENYDCVHCLYPR